MGRGRVKILELEAGEVRDASASLLWDRARS